MVTPAELLSRLTSVAATHTTNGSLPDRLCRALAEIAEMDGCSLSLGDSTPTRSMLHATDRTTARVEDLQDLLREGPGLDAYRLRHASRTAGADVLAQWPLLAQALGETPVEMLVAVPMMPSGDILGVLTLYRAPRHLAARDLELDELQFLADAIGTAVIGSFERSGEEESMWTTRDLISQATGMVVAQMGIGPVDALAVLRAHAFARGVNVADIAEKVVSRELDFKDEPTTATEDGDSA